MNGPRREKVLHVDLPVTLYSVCKTYSQHRHQRDILSGVARSCKAEPCPKDVSLVSMLPCAAHPLQCPTPKTTCHLLTRNIALVDTYPPVEAGSKITPPNNQLSYTDLPKACPLSCRAKRVQPSCNNSTEISSHLQNCCVSTTRAKRCVAYCQLS